MDVKGWSGYKLAKEAGLPQSTISHLCVRINAHPFPTIGAICGAFGITLAQFFADDDESVALTSEQKSFLLLFGSLSVDQQQIIKDTMRHFSKK